MIITTVQYGRLVNLGNYENEKLSATAAVGEGESPGDALEELRKWIDAEASERRSVLSNLAQAETRLAAARYELGEMDRQVAVMRDTWGKARRFLQTVGLDLPESYGMDDPAAEMPF